MQIRAFTLLLCLTAAPLAAQTSLTAEAYINRVAGGTYIINIPGQPPYGIEAYLPDQRVTWGWLETGECTEGRWHETRPGTLCYAYDGDDSLHCWQYFERDGDLFAQLTDENGKAQNTAPYELQQTNLSLPCVTDFLGS
jgi:hypothetical protein